MDESNTDSERNLNDPWTPQSPPAVPFGTDPPGFETYGFDPLESEKYLESLETKLARLKGKTREPTAKDMLKSIGHVKDAQLKALIDESDTPYISNHDYEASGELEPPAFASLQRRIYPEKQALTVEERKALVENDDLSKLKQSNQSQTTDSESASKKLEQTQPQCSSGENQ